MTNRNREEREALIEKAKQAISEYDIAKARRVSVAPDRLAILLAELVAVFEQAHTPTDDEREALAMVIEQGWGNPTWDGKTLRPIDRQIADAVLAAGFRRTVQGEPTDAEVRAVWDALGPAITVAFEYEELRAALRAAAAVREEGQGR